eukprot:CAMPEP_0197606598 /NCGR_PEP_ID=MMETSP1326-20131121/45424_1 /TAXON_ID=1155430 /ORGANISM="Genus nov. species nov., Strain RCC2288" /LENGTH=59 /DNA_ID=CAMNT_0043174531 /DNA_START=42 /DNA_END=217 /DNA_ORIENTATION=-
MAPAPPGAASSNDPLLPPALESFVRSHVSASMLARRSCRSRSRASRYCADLARGEDRPG